MDKFNRTLQREVLQALYDAHPNDLECEISDALENKFQDQNTLAANLLYLEEHGLICDATIKTLAVLEPTLFSAKITSHGIDFIREDGGLTVELKVQIVKIHDSTIVALEDILILSNLPAEQKQGILAKLRGLPADTIKHLTLQLLTKAALNPQAVLQIIQTTLHH